MSHSALKQLVSEGNATIIFIYGTARSGSTIAQVIFSPLADRAIHQPFTGLTHKEEYYSINYSEIYEAACGLIVNHIYEILEEKDRAILIVKEVSHFFDDITWKKWIQIPETFILTIREPHLQHLSWLSNVTSLYFKSNKTLIENRAFVLENALTTELIDLSTIKSGVKGTLLTYGEEQWKLFIRHLDLLRFYLREESKKIVIIDSICLRKNPEYVIEKILEKLEIKFENIEDYAQNFMSHSQKKIFDVRNSNRSSVKKARNSNQIDPLVEGEDISLYDFSPASKEHISRLIPLYLDLLYAPEQVGIPSLTQLDHLVAQSKTLKLEDTHPFVAYAIAKFYHQDKTTPTEEVVPIIQRILNWKTTTLHQEKKQINFARFSDSFDIVDRYWNGK